MGLNLEARIYVNQSFAFHRFVGPILLHLLHLLLSCAGSPLDFPSPLVSFAVRYRLQDETLSPVSFPSLTFFVRLLVKYQRLLGCPLLVACIALSSLMCPLFYSNSIIFHLVMEYDVSKFVEGVYHRYKQK